MLTTYKNVNVYGGSRNINNKLTKRVINVATMNLKPVVRQRIRMLFISILTALGFIYGIHKILLTTTSMNLAYNVQLIKTSWMAIRGNINVAIKMLEYLNKIGIPQAGYNMSLGAIGSISGNLMQLRTPRMKKAAITGVITAAVGSMFPNRTSALVELKKIQTTMTRAETVSGRYFSKGVNLTKTALGFQSQAQEVASLCAILTRYIIKLSLSFGINISRDIIKKVRFIRAGNAEKRVELLGDSDVRNLATQLMRTVTAHRRQNNSENLNAANILVSLSRNAR
jgi:hypothetical protein